VRPRIFVNLHSLFHETERNSKKKSFDEFSWNVVTMSAARKPQIAPNGLGPRLLTMESDGSALEPLGFHVLPAVQTVQPRLPEEQPERKISFDAVDKVPLPPLGTELSETFRHLMEDLERQHLAELTMALAMASPGGASPRLASPMSAGHGNSAGSAGNLSAGKSSAGSPGRSSAGSRGYSEAEDAPDSGRRKRRISQLMCQQHKNNPKMSASRIMKTFDNLDPLESSVELHTLKEDKNERTAFARLQTFLQSSVYEMMVAGLLCIYILWLGFELQVFGVKTGFELGIVEGTLLPTASLSYWDSVVFPAVDLTFTAIFTLDVFLRIVVLGKMFWKVFMNYLDVLVTVASFVEVIFFWAFRTEMGVNPMLFRLLRIGKLARAIRMVAMNSVLQSLQILTRCLVSSSNMLFWTFLLLTFFQCVAGLVAATLCREFIEDETVDVRIREDVYRYYGTFTRTFLTMFEILFANWSPPCRVLVDNISEWFSLFFFIYRCILGFAVLNVVNAVFVQQTMKIATSDEQLAFKQKERELAKYTQKVKNLFATMDASGDGVINFDEFSKLVQSPMLQFLLSQLDLEYHDLLSLFEFLDNGDGEITLSEFIDGAAKLRGNAKALDIWRMETKIEVLFVEVLHALRGKVDVQEAFEEHGFKHVTFSTPGRRTVVGDSALPVE